METKKIMLEKLGFSWQRFIWFAVALLLIGSELFAQTYQITVNQRRMGNKIGVEFWIKDITPNGTAPTLGNTSVAVTYNRDFLIPDGSNAYSSTDSIDYDMDILSPYHTIESPFSLAANGYLDLTAQPGDNEQGGNHVYVHQLDVNTAITGVGFKPASTGKGTFLGMLKFTIINYGNLTDNHNTDILFNTVDFVGPIMVFSYSGADYTSETDLVDQASYAVRGITVLNPNGPNQAVNRYPNPALTSLSPNKGYPIYFERSGLANNTNPQYGTPRFAYLLEYSLDEIGRAHV